MINWHALAKRPKKQDTETLRRRIRSGYVDGKVYSDGSLVVYESNKGITNWYTTRELVDKVTYVMDRNESISGKRTCPINSKGQLQIRGKHMRRLLKAMPNVRRHGRMLIEIKE